MTITLTQDESAYFDGSTMRAYFKGETYTSTHSIEVIVFQNFVDKGSAVPHTDAKPNKAIKPKAHK